MAESTKVRLVRCPKCENLLPEPEDCSVYQCGGCGAVLRAKHSDREADSGLHKEDRAKGTSVNSSKSTEKAVAYSSEASDSDVPSNSGSFRHRQNGPDEAWAVESDPCSKMNILDSGLNTILRDEEDPNTQSSGSDRFRKRTTKKNDCEGVRLSTSKFADEGPSNYFADSQKQLKDHCDEAIGQDRAGLLRKLDELKEQLVRSCNVAEISKDQVSSSSSGMEKAPPRIFGPGKHSAGPSYYHHYREPSMPYVNNHEIPMHGGIHPSSRNPAHARGYGDSLGFQMHGRAPQPAHSYYSGQYVGDNHDLFEPYPQNGIFHQPSCSCFHCYDKYRRSSASVVPPPGLADAPYNAGFYHHESIMGLGPHNYTPRTFVPPPLASSRVTQAHARWPSDFGGAHMNSLSRVRPPKVVLSGVSRNIRPLAGGAPFLTCQNCFELLQLPKKTDIAMKKQQKLRCGACSCLIDFSVVDKKFVLSASRETNPASTRDAETHMHRLTANFSSDDYDNAGYEFHSMDKESAEMSSGPALISVKPQEMQNLNSSSPSVSEDELSSDSLTAKPLPPDSPLHDHFDYDSINHAVHEHDQSGAGSRSSRSEQDEVTPTKTATRQNSMKDASVVATEMDVSFNEFSHNSGVSQDSRIGYRGDDLPKPRRGGFASIVKKSFKDLTKSSQNEERGKSYVSVNGHPISERLLKRAEKQAGTIQPGNYWYDYRAGFWGVMGGPCLGIIPPLIEELNYPMPEDCASGNTAVFVNGRELHRKDLELLAGRGLPPERHRSYMIDISGRVIDEDTGEELDSLGKLAPTIEKLKRGFGMKVPRRAA